MQPRQTWLLLFLGADGCEHDTDQVRVMKGLFLLSQTDGHPAREVYEFEPYDYGPFDGRIYRDLEALRLDGLVRVIQAGGSRKVYRLTEEGRRRFEELRAMTREEETEPVVEAKRRVTSMDFDALLADIYRRFPEFAVNSVARVAQQVR